MFVGLPLPPCLTGLPGERLARWVVDARSGDSEHPECLALRDRRHSQIAQHVADRGMRAGIVLPHHSGLVSGDHAGDPLLTHARPFYRRRRRSLVWR